MRGKEIIPPIDVVPVKRECIESLTRLIETIINLPPIEVTRTEQGNAGYRPNGYVGDILRVAYLLREKLNEITY
jgi:hypothetical protein